MKKDEKRVVSRVEKKVVEKVAMTAEQTVALMGRKTDAMKVDLFIHKGGIEGRERERKDGIKSAKSTIKQ